MTPPAAVAPAAIDPRIPRFTTFGWVSPPLDSTSAGRYAELAGAGLDLTVLALDDAGRREDNLHRLDVAEPVGARCLLYDRRLYRTDPRTPSGLARMDSVIGDYRDRPGFFGWYLGDEPAPAVWDTLALLADSLRSRDPGHVPWNNLLGRGAFPTRKAWEQYLRSYMDQLHPAVLCADYYDFEYGRDDGLFVENAAGLNALSRERGIPFWAIVLLVGHGRFRVPTEGELKWQVSMLLAYAARGVGYFTYWTPPPDPAWNWQPAVIGQDGTRTGWYGVLARFNPRVRAAGETLADLQWLSTTHAGSVPRGGTPFAPDGWVSAVSGRAALGHFADSSGARWLLVANADSAAGRTIGLRLVGTRRVQRLDPDGAWRLLLGLPSGRDLLVNLPLAAGDFALLKLEGTLDGISGSGAGPHLAIAPEPASERAQLSLAGVGARARVEILDGAGRRVWSREVPAGATTFDWAGEREAGGTVPAGVYFVRVEDARGVAVVRLHWLGRR